MGTLVVFDAVIRFLTAWLILKFRHRGPGLWWSAMCMTLALGVVYHPIVGILMGGIAGPSFVAPPTWGLFLLRSSSDPLPGFLPGKAWPVVFDSAFHALGQRR